MRRLETQSDEHAKNQGFSLIEMMVVLVILALMAGLFAPALRRGDREKSPEAVAYELQAVFLKARTNAISRGITETLHLDMVKREVSYANGKQTVSIPQNLEPTLLVGQELLAADGAAMLLFFPGGASSGVKVTFMDQRNNNAGVAVPWLTGVPIVLRDR